MRAHCSTNRFLSPAALTAWWLVEDDLMFLVLFLIIRQEQRTLAYRENRRYTATIIHIIYHMQSIHYSLTFLLSREKRTT